MAMKAGTCTYVTCVYMWLTTLHLAGLHVHQGQVHVRDMYILLCISILLCRCYSGPDITIPTHTNFCGIGVLWFVAVLWFVTASCLLCFNT